MESAAPDVEPYQQQEDCIAFGTRLPHSFRASEAVNESLMQDIQTSNIRIL